MNFFSAWAGLILFCSLGFSKTWQEAPKGDLLVKYGTEAPSLDVEIKRDRGGSAPKHTYKPSPATWSYISLGYANLGASLGTKNAIKDQDKIQYGSTTAADYQFRFYGNRFSHEIFYQRYTGYYLENTSDVVANYDMNSPRLLQPNLTTEAMGYNLIYNPHPDQFSIGGTFAQSALLKDSGGTWLAIASIDKHRFSNPTSLILGTAVGQYDDFENIRSVNYYTASFGGGGGYTLVYRNFYIGGLALISTGYEYQLINSTTGDSQLGSGVLRANMKTAAGYNGERLVTGVSASFDNNNAALGTSTLSLNTGDIQVYVGLRLHECNLTWLDQLSDYFF